MPETPTNEVDVQVMFFDTDCAGVVHNIAYLRFVEIARTQLGEQVGFGLEEMTATQLFPVVRRTEIDYLRPATLGEKLVVSGRLDKIEGARFWLAFQITRPKDGAVIVDCRQMMALVQMPAGRPMRLPKEWDTRFAHLKA
jgi:YbgC/YbaW family acyl-CoA thioester hydrolase